MCRAEFTALERLPLLSEDAEGWFRCVAMGRDELEKNQARRPRARASARARPPNPNPSLNPEHPTPNPRPNPEPRPTPPPARTDPAARSWRRS